MKFGVALPYNQAGNVPHWARLAEEAGWDGCFLGDAIWCEDPMMILAAAAMTTSKIRLGTLIVPAPLRRPWKLASESLALDRLSNGRFTCGLGAGAIWMGWQGFPDEITATQTRAEMLDETIDILTILNQSKQVDYEGNHHHLKLTLVDEMHYPPQTIQQPRVPVWVPGLWPRKKSMQRILKCDGVLPEKVNADGHPEAVTPADVREMKAYIDAQRTLTTPFDIVIIGKTEGMDVTQQRETLLAWEEAGATWWIEDLFNAAEEIVPDRVAKSPPTLE